MTCANASATTTPDSHGLLQPLERDASAASELRHNDSPSPAPLVAVHVNSSFCTATDDWTPECGFESSSPTDTDREADTNSLGLAGTSSGPRHFAWLVRLNGPRKGDEIRLSDSARIGRRQGVCGIVINEPSVSQLHAEIYWSDEGFVIRDLGSIQGTYVNDEPIEQRLLSDKDRIKLGDVEFAFFDVLKGLLKGEGS